MSFVTGHVIGDRFVICDRFTICDRSCNW